VALGRKPARDALDFVRAVHQLGSYRGVESFERYGLLMRSGMAFLATSLAHVEVVANPRAQLLADLDKREWLSRFRRFAQGDTVATRFRVLRRKLEEALFGLASRNPSAPETQAALVLLGEINSALASSRKALEAVSPVPRLSEQWVQAANDSTPAFRIARALAGLKGTSDMLLPLLSQLLPVHPVHNTWMTPEYRGKNASKDPYCRVHIHSDAKGRLPDVMVTLLRDRLSLAQRLNMRDPGNILVSKPLQSAAGVDLTDLLQFLNGDRLDQRIAQLLPGLCLCKILPDQEPSAGEAGVPAAFALIKLVLTPDEALRGLGLLDTTDFLPVPSTLIGQLASGNIGNRAVRAAWRRLTASRLTPAVSQRALPELIGISPLRAAAALLIPLRSSAIRAMSRMILADGGKQRGGEQAHAADLLTQEGETV
jgi:CRISPR-associated protein Csx17